MLGLALEGGGAKGAFHMGVVKAFMHEGYHFDGVTGTSIGALNGAIIAQGDFEKGYKLWEEMETSMLFDIERTEIQKIVNKKIDITALLYLKTKLKDIIDNKGLDTGKIRNLLDEVIDEEKLRKSPVDFGLVTVSVSDYKPLELYKEDIPGGMLIAYLMASANYPVFKIEPIDGKYYIDGGFYDNCPVNLLVRKGYQEIVAVRTLSMGVIRKVEEENIKVTTILPSGNLGRILNFDNSVIKNNLKMGYYDALRVLRGLSGNMYYIKPPSSDSFMRNIWEIPDEVIISIGRLMFLQPMDTKRMLWEKIFPALAKLLKLPTNATYQDIIIGIFETLAEDLKIDRFEIFSFQDFIRAISDRINGVSGHISSPVVGIKKLNSVLSGKFLLRQVARELIGIFQKWQ